MGMFNLFGRASGFVRYLLLVGLLSADQFALATYAFSIGKLARHFIDGGLDNLVSRDGAREYEKIPAFYVNALVLKGILTILFFVGVLGYLVGVRDLSITELVVVYAALAGSAMISFTGVVRSCFTAIERMEYIFYTNMPSRLVSLVLLFLALWFSLPLVFAVAAISFENVLWFVLLGAISLRFFRFSLSGLSWSFLRYLVVESWALALYGFFNIFYLSLDVLMIEYLMGGREAVAPYTYASLLLEGVTLLLTSYFIAVYPTLSRLYVSDFAAYQRLFRQSFVALLAFTIPVSVMLGYWADLWMHLVKDTGPLSTQVLRILAVNLNLSMLNTLLIIVFTSCNRQRLLVIFTAMAVGISFLTNWEMIPWLQQPGAAWASLLSQTLLLVIMATKAKRLFHLSFPLQKPLALAGVSLLAAVLASWTPWIPPMLEPVVGFMIWMVLVYLFRIVTREEFEKISRLMREG